MNRFQDAFISYGRADSKAFAKKLNDRLVEQGLEIWFDFEDIPLGVDYQNQIDDGIEKADHFLFIISPHAVNSPYCAKEIHLALQYNKRVIPLLHVEQIDRHTWQQRHPAGTDAEWQDYQTQGLHSSYPHMHPVISKINWVYFREGVDDFELALVQLLAIFDRQRDYVRQHTDLLSRALHWQRNYRQTRYLLVGEEHQRAREWLTYRFEHEQSPCLPTDLHCELITESTKNANNLMTQVFLCWDDRDRSFMEQIRLALIREGLTVWISQTDIQKGANYHQVIQQGIEQADNFVCLVSPHSIRSSYCLREAQYAFSLNKRLVPLVILPVDLTEVPEEFRAIQYIDFTEYATAQSAADRVQQGVAELIKILRQEAAYYEDHKLLLSKALKWERQQRNPCLLLRGYNLRYAETWLKLAQHHSQHPPIAIQQAFIAASLQQPPGLALDVFVSYSRRDSEFARQLNQALQMQGKTTWFDQESIAAGTADFQQEIYSGIEASSYFLFIISPSSVNSPYCADEVAHAVRHNKRIITLLHQRVDATTLPPGLATVQWIDFNQYDRDFTANFQSLLRTLDTDPEHLRIHTRLLMRALEWDQHQRDENLLLRGTALKEVQHWLLTSEHKTPQPTQLQRQYVTTSNVMQIRRQRATLRLQRVGLGVVSVVSCVAIGLAVTAYRLYQQAKQLQLEAQQEQVLEETKTSEALFQSNQELEALLAGMQAGIQLQRHPTLKNEPSHEPIHTAVITALQQAVFWVQERQRIEGHQGMIWAIDISADGQLLASASDDRSIKLWRSDGTLLREFKTTAPQLAVAFAPRDWFVAGGGDHRVVIYPIELAAKASDQPSQPAVQRQVLVGHTAPVVGLAVSPNGQTIASASEDATIRLWNAQGKRLHILEGHDAAVRSVVFSPDGQTIASASDDGTVRLWDLQGRLLHTLRGHTAEVRSVAFSPDGKLLASASWDETIRLWRSDGTAMRTIEGHDTLVSDVQFSPDGQTLATASWDKTVKLWTLDGAVLSTLTGHSALVRSIRFHPTEETIISTGADRTIRLWNLDRPLLATLQDHRARVYSVAFAPDDQQIASAGADNVVRLWDRQGRPQQQLRGHQSVVWSVSYSPDGATIASASSDHMIKLWNRQGRLLKTLVGHAGPVHAVEFSPDGATIASASADQTVRLWRRDGTLIRTLRNFSDGVLNVRFSPDGQTIATASWDNLVKLWTLEGEQQQVLSGHQGWVYDISFSHDGQSLLTASYDNTAKLWSREGRLLQTLSDHNDGVVAARFSSDDRLIATASHDGTVKLWTHQGELITTLRGHRDRVSDVNFSHDGRLLATASEDKTVLLWHLDLQGELNKLLTQGCQWSQDYLKTRSSSDAIDPDVHHFCQQMQSVPDPE